MLHTCCTARQVLNTFLNAIRPVVPWHHVYFFGQSSGLVVSVIDCGPTGLMPLPHASSSALTFPSVPHDCWVFKGLGHV